MSKRTGKIVEKQYVNKVAIMCHLIIEAVLLVAYLIEVLKGARTIGYYLIFIAIIVVSSAGELIIYRKNAESEKIRHLIGFGYGIMYLFALFTSDNLLTFVYVLPIYMVITLFSDVKYCVNVCLCGVGANVVDVAYRALTVGYTKEQLADVEIRIALIILMSVFLIISTYVLNKVNQSKMEEIQNEKEKTADLLSSVMDISGRMIGNVEQASEKMEILGNSVMEIRNAMQEVSTGSNETAESMQQQLFGTEQIQNQIGKVKSAAEDITVKMNETGEEVAAGIQNIERLAAQAEKSIEANEVVVSKMEQLAENAARMNEVVDMISSIANRTGMLALNASIESARAGEAGKGFAVVAGEITNLANQTKGATVDITEMIRTVTEELREVEKAVEIVSDNNRSNAERTQEVTEGFGKISDSTKSINLQAVQMGQAVEELVSANVSIVQSVENVSATTEEMSAYAAQTYQACEENSKLVEEVSEIVKALSEHAEELKSK